MRHELIRLTARLLKAPLPEQLPLPFDKSGFATYALATKENGLDAYPPDDRLISLIAETLPHIAGIHFPWVERISPPANTWPDTWPGEHYKLLAALMKTMKPEHVFEVGTYTGMSSLAIKEHLPDNAQIITYDICPWDKLDVDASQRPIRQEDFDARLVQKILDLTEPTAQREESVPWQDADFIFIDAAKDGAMEYLFIDFLDSIVFKKPPIVVFDDIKFLSMLDVWNSIKHPKWDISSLGHWSGTGIVHWI